MNREQREFQEYARRWLAENAPPPPPERLPILPIEVMTADLRDYLQDWQRRCYAAGLVGADIPKAYGGGGHEGFQHIANHELSRARTPMLINVVGLQMAVPTILVHGTEEQKRKLVPGALSGEEIWCQGFSEPGAGSDLANQQTLAVRKGDVWIVNGHKVWTSLGHFAKWMILLTRTSREHKYDGLTYFVCPIAGHPGVTVKPLVKITGESGFNEVLFEDVEIPDSLRLACCIDEGTEEAETAARRCRLVSPGCERTWPFETAGSPASGGCAAPPPAGSSTRAGSSWPRWRARPRFRSRSRAPRAPRNGRG